jgi:hypothetical protein
MLGGLASLSPTLCSLRDDAAELTNNAKAALNPHPEEPGVPGERLPDRVGRKLKKKRGKTEYWCAARCSIPRLFAGRKKEYGAPGAAQITGARKRALMNMGDGVRPLNNRFVISSLIPLI